MSEWDDYQDTITKWLAFLENKIKTINVPATGNQGGAQLGNAGNVNLKLRMTTPQVPLPTFSGREGECIDTFLDNFEKQMTDFKLMHTLSSVF